MTTASAFAGDYRQVADLVRRSYGDVEVVRFRPGAGAPTATVRSDGQSAAQFALLYALAETDVACAGDRLVLSSGTCCVARNLPTRVTGAAPDLVIVYIPDSITGAHQRSFARAVGRVFSTRTGTPSLVAHLLDGLAAQLDDYAPSNPSRLAHHLIGLLTLMCADGTTDNAGTAKLQLLERSKEFIEGHLGDADLTPDRIADALHVSSRTLHRIYEADGLTIAGWIRSRRLEQCRLDLADAVLAEIPVSHIASRWGLWDASHFSRLFKASFGVSPRAYRVAHGTGGAAADRLSAALPALRS